MSLLSPGYRTFIWYRFLWQVSRLPLHLNYLHPDRSGGLGFLDRSVTAFKTGLLAHTVLLAGVIANGIWHAGKTLIEFKLQIVSILLFLIFLVLTPLLFFITALVQTKRKGLVDYGILAGDYVNNFNAKWIGKPLNNNEVLLGSSDIQSLADLSNSFNVVKEMRVVPFNRSTLIQLILEIGFPILPLLLTIIPVSEMINGVIKIFL